MMKRRGRLKGAIIASRAGSIKNPADGSDHIHEIVGPIVDKVTPGQFRGGQAQEGGEQEHIGEVNEREGEEGAVLLQVGLITRDNPEGPEQVEAPGRTHHGKEDLLVMGQGANKADYRHENEYHHRPEGYEVGRKGDEDV